MAPRKKPARKRNFSAMNKDGEPELGRPAKRVLRSNAALRNATTPNRYRATVADEPEVDVSMHTAAAEEADVDISMRDASQAAEESNMDISMRDASNAAAEQSIMDISMRDASPRGPVSGDVSMSVESSEGQVNQPYSGPSAASSFDVPDDYEFSFSANASLPDQHLSPLGTTSSFNPDSSVHGSPLRPAANTGPIPAEQDAQPALSEPNSVLTRSNESQQIVRNVVREEIRNTLGPHFSAISTSLENIQTTQREQQTALEGLRTESRKLHSELREEYKGQAKERKAQANERTQARHERQDQANERTQATQERQAQADERQAQSQERVDQDNARTQLKTMRRKMLREHKKADTELRKAGTARAHQSSWPENEGLTKPTSDQSVQVGDASALSFTSGQGAEALQPQQRLQTLAARPANSPDDRQVTSHGNSQGAQPHGQPGGWSANPEEREDTESLFGKAKDFCRMQ